MFLLLIKERFVRIVGMVRGRGLKMYNKDFSIILATRILIVNDP